MMATHGQLSVSLWTTEDPEKKAVPFLISRILEQKGGFRNISEESLQGEIVTGESGVEDVESPVDKAEEDEKPRPEQLQAARQDIWKFTQCVNWSLSWFILLK